MLLQLGGLNVITDPIFSERASPLASVRPKRHQPPGLRLDELPRIDAVVPSHDHYDSRDVASLPMLARQAGGSPRFLVPWGLGTSLRSIGVERVDELDWWQSRTIEGATGASDRRDAGAAAAASQIAMTFTMSSRPAKSAGFLV